MMYEINKEHFGTLRKFSIDLLHCYEDHLADQVKENCNFLVLSSRRTSNAGMPKVYVVLFEKGTIDYMSPFSLEGCTVPL